MIVVPSRWPAWLLTGLAWLWLAGCAPDDEAVGPRYAATPPAGRAVPVFRLAVHPLFNPQKLNKAYGPLVAYLSGRIDQAHFELEASNDYAHFEQKFSRREPHFLLPNPYQSLLAQRQGYHVLAEMGDSADFRGIFVVRKDAGIERPADLRGKAVAYPAATALAAAMMPQLWLAEHGLSVRTELENRYVGSQQSALLAAYRREAAVGVTWPPPWREFRQSHPQEAAELTVLWETEPLINNAFMARDDLPPALVEAVRQALLGLHEHPEGRAVLAAMETARVHPADDARYRQALEGFLWRYAEKVGALP